MTALYRSIEYQNYAMQFQSNSLKQQLGRKNWEICLHVFVEEVEETSEFRTYNFKKDGLRFKMISVLIGNRKDLIQG